MKAEFQEFPGRPVYTDVEREGVPPKDVDRPSAAPRAVEEEEDRASALMPTVPLMTSPPPSLLEIDLESQQSLRGALQSEIAASSVSQGPPSTDRSHREVSSLQRTPASEAEKQEQTLESDQRVDCQEQHPQGKPSEELTEGRSPSNRYENVTVKLQMSLQRSVLGWRVQPVPSFDPELTNLDTELPSQLQKQKRCGLKLATRVRVSCMCSQGTSSEAKDPCSITTDLPFQRDALCGPF